MRLVVAHEGFIKGQPSRYRHVGEMCVKMETVVDIETVSVDDAPMAYVFENRTKGFTKEYRVHDGHFVTPLPSLKRREGALAEQMLNIEAFQDDSRYVFRGRYRKLCGWREFASNSIGNRGGTIRARELHEWNAKHIDDSDACRFSDAVHEVMKDLVVIDGKLWNRCFEPCLTVRWRVSPQVGVKIQVNPFDTRNLHGDLGRDSYDEMGNRVIAPTAYNYKQHEQFTHERCFSVFEKERVREFVKLLQAGAVANKTSVMSEQRLTAVTPDLCTRNYDDLELARSVKTHSASWDNMASTLKSMTGDKWKRRVNVPEFESRQYDLESALADFRKGAAAPEDVIEAMSLLRQGMEWVAGAMKRDYGVNVYEIVPPVYFGDLDNLAVELTLSGLDAPATPRSA